MKKNIIGSAITMLLAIAGPVAYADSAPGAGDRSTVILAEKSPNETLQTRIEAQNGTDYSRVKRLVIQTGTLKPEDCRFIKQNLTGLEELIVEGKADFMNGVIPKGAFEGVVSLKKIRINNATEVAMKAFSLCESIEEVDLPNVTKTGVQAFAQAKAPVPDGCG